MPRRLDDRPCATTADLKDYDLRARRIPTRDAADAISSYFVLFEAEGGGSGVSYIKYVILSLFVMFIYLFLRCFYISDLCRIKWTPESYVWGNRVEGEG